MLHLLIFYIYCTALNSHAQAPDPIPSLNPAPIPAASPSPNLGSNSMPPVTRVPSVAVPTRVEVDRIEENVIFFKAPPNLDTPKPLKTDLYDLSYLGVIYPPENERGANIPYFLFGAKPCKSCQHDRTIYAVRTDKGRVQAFTYPGRILDPKSRAILMEARAFFGRCLREKHDVFVVFQKERLDRKRNLQASVFVAEPNEVSLTEKLIERRLPAMRETLGRVKAKHCREIEGRNRFMLNRPLDLTPRKSGDENEDEEDDAGSKDESASEDGNSSPAAALVQTAAH